MSYDGLTFIEPKALYNLLQQATFYSCLSDPNYLLLIGKVTCRSFSLQIEVVHVRVPMSVRLHYFSWTQLVFHYLALKQCFTPDEHIITSCFEQTH